MEKERSPPCDGRATAGRVGTFYHIILQSKHQLMTASMVRVTNLTPGSDNPNGWDALARLSARCADNAAPPPPRQDASSASSSMLGSRDDKTKREQQRRDKDAAQAAATTTTISAGFFVANGREHSVARVAADVLCAGLARDPAVGL
jgi:hypothetical protein